MKKSFLLALMAYLLLVPVAFAAGRPPTIDASGFASTAMDGGELRAVSSGAGNCVPSGTSYLEFDLSNISTTITNARLTLTYTLVNVGSGPATIEVLAVTDNEWTESSVRTNTPPTGTPLGTVSYTAATQPTMPGVIVFNSADTTGSGLPGFLDSQAKNDPQHRASLAIRVTNCGTGTYEYRFASVNNADLAIRPSLELFGPNAVSLSTADAQPTTSWPLYAGLGVVALFVVAGVVATHRRTA